jgi:hypothetical protein
VIDLRPLALAGALLAAAAGCSQRESGASTIARSADELFTERLVPRFELELDDAARQSLARAPKEWVHGTFHYAGQTYRDVGVRLKGNRSRQGLSGKPAFKIRFDKFVKKRRFLGLREIVLNNLVEDPTMVREALAYRLHREMGVPAPRTGWAQLWLDGRDLGLYLDIERLYADDGGTLYEGEFGCDLYPDDAPRFEQDDGKDQQHADLVELAQVATADPGRLFASGGPLDVERVVAYLAVSNVIGDFDGYRHSHNYRLHHEKRGGRWSRWSMMPWGLDRSFKKSLDPMDSGGVLARRCFADDACRAAYGRALAKTVDTLDAIVASGTLDNWFILVDAASPTTAAKDARAQLRRFLAQRPAEVRASLASLAAPPAPPAPACDDVTVAGARFALCTTPLTWADAEAHCTTLGRHLARIDDEAQSRALAAVAADASTDRWWIGLSDRAQEGHAAWADGAPVTFTRWSKGQPDDAACGEDCTALKPKIGAGTWSDAHCALRRPFICR